MMDRNCDCSLPVDLDCICSCSSFCSSKYVAYIVYFEDYLQYSLCAQTEA